jgi:glycosyltransferase involved in cell wall biosynthesis
VIAAPEPPRPPHEGPVRILLVGKLAERRKEHFALVGALETLRERPFTLTVAGSSSTAIGTPDAANRDRLLAYPRDGLIGDRVTVLPDVPFDAMPALYRAHDLCVLPSRGEPLGTAPLEAMAHGAAALVSDECGSVDVIAEAERAGLAVGALFPAGDGAALTAALARFIDDPAGTRAMGETARRWTAEFLSPERFVARFREAAARAGVPADRLPAQASSAAT